MTSAAPQGPYLCKSTNISIDFSPPPEKNANRLAYAISSF
ncbi:hypothetical protein MICA_1356 [Micavibrio aeruginosavorus ARL-13]|uniref:Uncharacterized protein n=2 Tax=Micavibrio aeruginosavorus TaxID=349221 RepID=G2KSS8_MICAA|nr:hypothetical protein MICA_1356 [Micavibrio aeruginosavorus ARL-13]